MVEYRSTAIQPDIFQVYARGNGYTSTDWVFKIALVRSAEIAKENGYDYFYILDISDSEKTYYQINLSQYGRYLGGNIMPISKPICNMLIKIVKEPEEGQPEPMSADFIINNVKPELEW